MVLAVLLLRITFYLHHWGVFHQRSTVLRVVFGSIVVLELLLEVEAVFGALVLVNGRTALPVLHITHLLRLVSDLLE